jgi:hypothetical protein
MSLSYLSMRHGVDISINSFTSFEPVSLELSCPFWGLFGISKSNFLCSWSWLSWLIGLDTIRALSLGAQEFESGTSISNTSSSISIQVSVIWAANFAFVDWIWVSDLVRACASIACSYLINNCNKLIVLASGSKCGIKSFSKAYSECFLGDWCDSTAAFLWIFILIDHWDEFTFFSKESFLFSWILRLLVVARNDSILVCGVWNPG